MYVRIAVGCCLVGNQIDQKCLFFQYNKCFRLYMQTRRDVSFPGGVPSGAPAENRPTSAIYSLQITCDDSKFFTCVQKSGGTVPQSKKWGYRYPSYIMPTGEMHLTRFSYISQIFILVLVITSIVIKAFRRQKHLYMLPNNIVYEQNLSSYTPLTV